VTETHSANMFRYTFVPTAWLLMICYVTMHRSASHRDG